MNYRIQFLLVLAILAQKAEARKNRRIYTTTYWADIKNELTGKTFKGRFTTDRFPLNKEHFQVTMVLYEEDKFLSKGESLSIIIPFGRSIAVNKNGEKNRMEVEATYTKFSSEGPFNKEEESKLQVDIEFYIKNPDGYLDLDDLKNEFKVSDGNGKFTYSALNLDRAIYLQYILLVPLYMVAFCGFMIMSCPIQTYATKDEFNFPFFGNVPGFFIPFVCLRVAIQYPYLASLFIIPLGLFIWALKRRSWELLLSSKMRKLSFRIEELTNLYYGWFVLNGVICLVVAILSVKMLPFLIFLYLIGNILDMYFLISDPKSFLQTTLISNFYTLFLVGYEYYSPVTLFLHRIDISHFLIWLSILVILIVVMLVLSNTLKKRYYGDGTSGENLPTEMGNYQRMNRDQNERYFHQFDDLNHNNNQTSYSIL